MVNEIDYSTISRTSCSFKTHQYINSELLQSFAIYGSPWHISSDMDLDSIIHMHWVKPDLEDIKVHDLTYSRFINHIELIDDAINNTESLIDDVISFLPNIVKADMLKTVPIINNNDKKTIEKLLKGGNKK